MEASHSVQPGVTLIVDDAAWEIAADGASGPGGRRGPPVFGGGLAGGFAPPDAGDDPLDPQTQWLVSHLAAGPGVSTQTLPAVTRRADAGARALGATAPAPRVDVELADDESAVLLVESEGVVAWQLPDATDALPPFAPGSPVRAVPGATRRARFAITVPGGAIGGPAGQRSVVADWTLRRVRAVVLKFVARQAAGPLVARLERGKRDGPVVLTSGSDPTAWTRPDDFAQLKLPERGARVLLFVHGTFSSTLGGFGELCATAWGQAFLAEAHAKYDAVIGYDHRTLTVDPLRNAQMLHDSLRTLPTDEPPAIDIVCHSRGGLVVRALVEHVLAQSTWRPAIGHVVFVAATNAGTELARPGNWRALIDLTTNLVLVGRRALAILGAPHVGLVAGEVLDGVGDFVRALVEAAIEDGLAPGLAAMDPAGDFVRTINAAPSAPRTDGGPAPAVYHAIESDFRPTLLDPDHHEPREFPRRLALMFAGGFMDALMQDARNDLVVDTASMTAIGGRPLDVAAVQDFGSNAAVYHTNYFVQPETIDALAHWLGLASTGAVAAVDDALADRRIVLVDAATPVGQALVRARFDDAGYVVVQRPDPRTGRLQCFAATVAEVQGTRDDRGPQTVGAVFDALRLPPSPQLALGASLLRAAVAPAAREGPLGRGVVFDGDRPVAVLQAVTEMSAIDVLARASAPVMRQVRGEGGGGGLPERSEVAGAMPDPGDEPDRPTWLGTGYACNDTGVAPPFVDPRPQQQQTQRQQSQDAPEQPAASASPVVCNALAEMPGRVKVGATAIVSVTLSVDAIAATPGMAGARGVAALQPGRPVTIEVRPRAGYALKSDVPEDACVVLERPPAPGAPAVIDVELVATDVGAGEVLAIVRQGAVRRLTLVLASTIVDAAASTAGDLARGRGALAAGEDVPDVAALEIWQQRNGDELRFVFRVEIPGVALNRFESPRLKGDIRSWVDTLYKGIEGAWLGSAGNREIFQDNLKAKGAVLVADLVPLPVRQLLWRLHAADQLGSLLMRSDEPFVPWEIAYLDDPAQPGDARARFFGELGLCRWLLGSPEVTRIRIRADRRRYVLPHYPDPRYRLQAAEEHEEPMLQALGAQRIAPHYADTRDALKAGGFDLLHFAGHGGAESGNIGDAALLLEGTYETVEGTRRYLTEPLSVAVVATNARLRGAGGERPLVILNACQAGKLGFGLTSIGGFAPAFLGVREGDGNAAGEAGAFVSALWSVGDQPASAFAQAFYDAIAAPGGATVGRAAARARAAARDAGDATWLAYAVYAHPNCHVEFTP